MALTRVLDRPGVRSLLAVHGFLVPARRRLTTTPACRSEQAPGEAACSANTYSLEKRVKSLLAVCGGSHYCDIARAALCGPPFSVVRLRGALDTLQDGF